MKISSKILLGVLFIVVSTLGMVGLIKAATTVDLGTADNFAILAGSTITNTGPSVINGDLGLSPGTAVTGFPPGTINGEEHLTDAVALQAQNDLTTAYNDAAGQTPVTTVATELGGTTKTAGTYNSASGTFEMTGTLTLDAQDDPDAVFIFKTATTLITASSSKINLINGAQSCHVFWQVGSSVTLGANSTFRGNILAFTSVTLTTGASVDGRVLARNAAVILDTNTITPAVGAISPTPATLHVIKRVINDDGGTATVSLFNLHVKLSGVDVSGSPTTGTATPGTSYSLVAGTYVVSEDSYPSYLQSFSGDCAWNGSVTLIAGDDKTCIVTNTYNDASDSDILVIPTTLPDSSINPTNSVFTWSIVVADILTVLLLYVIRKKIERVNN